MASIPVVSSPADYSSPGLPFTMSGTSDGVLVEIRDDAGLLLPATANPVPVSGGAWSTSITALVGNRGAVYSTASGEVATAIADSLHISSPTGGTYAAGASLTVSGTLTGTGFDYIQIFQMDSSQALLGSDEATIAENWSQAITLIAGARFIRVAAQDWAGTKQIWADNDGIAITV